MLFRGSGVPRFTAQCAHAYGKIRSQLKRGRKLIGPNDMLIAATAMANQATLVSNNRKEFARIQGLELESWYEVDIERTIRVPLPRASGGRAL